MIYLEIYVLLIVILLLICVKVDSVFKKYETVDNKKNVSGMEIARNVLDENELQSVYVIERKEKVMDNYIYKRKTIVLSSDVFHENSLYSLAVGAYMGMQGIYDKKKDSLFRFVKTFSSIKTFSYFISWMMFFLVVFSYNETGALLALILLLLSIVFSVMEFVVHKKIAYEAYDYLKNKKYFNDEEDEGISKVLQNVYLDCFTWHILEVWYPLVNTVNESKKK